MAFKLDLKKFMHILFNQLIFRRNRNLFELFIVLYIKHFQKIQHTYELDLPKTDKRSAHTAKLGLKFGTVNITKPKYNPDETLPESITLQLVEVKEFDQTVVGKEKPVHSA